MNRGPDKLFGADTIRFVIAGSSAFLLDASILLLLVRFDGWNPFAARVVSMGIATIFAWLAHRYWTFETGRLRSPGTQTILHPLVQLIGFAINYLVFSALIFVGAFWRTYPVLAVAAGSVAAMGMSYLLSKTVTFADPGGQPLRKMRAARSSSVE